MSGYVYVVGNSCASKIGYSFNPKVRVKEVANSYFKDSEFEVYISDISLNAREWETRCHEMASLFKISNEFFSIAFDKSVNLVKKLKPDDSCYIKEKEVKSEILDGNYINSISLINDCEKMILDGSVLGDLTSLWAAGNIMRVQDGLSAANLSTFLKSEKTTGFINVCKLNGCKAPYHINGSGNKKRTWASIHLMVYAAEHLSVNFHYEVIDAFIKGKIKSYDTGDSISSNYHLKELIDKI